VIGAAHLMMRQGSTQPKGLFAWGNNGYGNLGLGDITPRSSPVQVGSLTDWSADNGKLSGSFDVAGGKQTFLIKTAGTLWSCGGNVYGELGLGDRTSRSSPVQVGSGTDWAQIATGVNGSTSEGGANAVAAIKTTGSLWTWGNGGGWDDPCPEMFGRGAVSGDFSSPVQVGALLDWSKIAITHNAMCAIKNDGTLWAWGRGENGQLGIPDRVTRNSPVQVGALLSWTKITGFQTSSYWDGFLAIRSNGTLWAWGGNYNYGYLGLNDRTPRSSPTQVGSATDWEQVSAGEQFALAIRTGGTLWAWGYNGNGQLGLGDINVHRSSPVQVGSDTNWSKVYAHQAVSLAIKTNGTLWAWGAASGAQGSGDLVIRSSPVQVGSGTNWTGLSIIGSHVFGVRT